MLTEKEISELSQVQIDRACEIMKEAHIEGKSPIVMGEACEKVLEEERNAILATLTFGQLELACSIIIGEFAENGNEITFREAIERVLQEERHERMKTDPDTEKDILRHIREGG